MIDCLNNLWRRSVVANYGSSIRGVPIFTCSHIVSIAVTSSEFVSIFAKSNPFWETNNASWTGFCLCNMQAHVATRCGRPRHGLGKLFTIYNMRVVGVVVRRRLKYIVASLYTWIKLHVCWLSTNVASGGLAFETYLEQKGRSNKPSVCSALKGHINMYGVYGRAPYGRVETRAEALLHVGANGINFLFDVGGNAHLHYVGLSSS